jgi:LytS/YehU family sensor histidine kinase
VGITIQSPKKVKYQYILEGLESEWNSLTNRTEASYSNLPHGNFTFRVKAMNGDGYWSKEFTYPFRIRPPWWHTWWAYTLFAAASLGFVYALFRYRLDQVRRENEIKHKTAALEMQVLRAQMNPHFIFNSLNAINLFILENNKLQASEYLAKFSRLVRLILTNSREAFIPLEQEMDALNLYLELESLRLEHKFTYSVAIANEINAAEIKIPPLIIQPYVENAIWHGLMNKKDAGRLRVELYLENEDLFCKITDNGIGRARAAEYKSKFTSERKSMGMRITADRIAMLTNENDNTTYLDIKDLIEADGSPGGTEVTLKIPVSYD